MSLSELLTSAERFSTWWTSKKKQKPQDKITAMQREIMPAVIIEKCPADIPFYAYEQPRTCDALFALSKRLLEAGEYDRCKEALSDAVDLVTLDSEKFSYELLLGKLFLEIDGEKCEGYLLRADNICCRCYGETSSKRIEIAQLLASWYLRNGEFSQVLILIKRMHSVDISERMHLSPKRRFLHDYFFATLLRESGLYNDSVYVLRLFIWEVVLKETGPMPDSMPVTLAAFTESEITRRQCAKLHLLYAYSSTDDNDLNLASEMLNIANEIIGESVQHDDLKISIELERGRISRKSHNVDRALRHYQDSEKMMKEQGSLDLHQLYYLHLNRGVALRCNGDKSKAQVEYEKAWAIAGKLQLQTSPFIYELLQSQAVLAMEKKDYVASLEFARESADILSLKAHQRHYHIGVARMRQGWAHKMLKEYPEALTILRAARAEFDLAGGPGKHGSVFLQMIKEVENASM